MLFLCCFDLFYSSRPLFQSDRRRHLKHLDLLLHADVPKCKKNGK